MNVKEAMAIVLERYPDKKIIGNPAEYKGMYCFSAVSKDYVDGTPNWDSTVTAVDIQTGEISQFGALENFDFMDNAKPLEKEEL